jgi:hypothetical protein
VGPGGRIPRCFRKSWRTTIKERTPARGRTIVVVVGCMDKSKKTGADVACGCYSPPNICVPVFLPAFWKKEHQTRLSGTRWRTAVRVGKRRQPFPVWGFSTHAMAHGRSRTTGLFYWCAPHSCRTIIHEECSRASDMETLVGIFFVFRRFCLDGAHIYIKLHLTVL